MLSTDLGFSCFGIFEYRVSGSGFGERLSNFNVMGRTIKRTSSTKTIVFTTPLTIFRGLNVLGAHGSKGFATRFSIEGVYMQGWYLGIYGVPESRRIKRGRDRPMRWNWMAVYRACNVKSSQQCY